MSDEIESKVLDTFRWWRMDDLFSTRERLTPLSLAAIVERYLRAGAPAPTALEVEVLVD